MKKIAFLVICIALASCGFNIEKEIKHPYYLVSVDTDSYINVSIKLPDGNYVGRIPNTVIEYALVGNYIFAKQQEYDIRYGFNSTVNYYVLKMGSRYPEKLNLEKFKAFLVSKNIKKFDWVKT